MRKFNKLLMLLLMIFSLAFIASCGKNKDSDDKPTPEVTTPEVTTPEVTTPEPTTPEVTTPEETTPEETTPEPTRPAPEDIDVSKVKFFNSIVTYNGEEHSLAVVKRTIPEGVEVVYENNGHTEVGEYVVIAKLLDKHGNVLREMTATLTIQKVKKDISKVKFEDTKYIWDKDTEEYKVLVTNLPEGVRVEYTDNVLTDVGCVTATAKLYDEFDNELLKTLTAELKVNYQIIHDENVFASSDVVLGTENEAEICIIENALNDVVNVTYNNNSATSQGIYLASALVEFGNGDIVEYRATLTVDNPTSTAFEEYSDEMFIYFLEGDQSTLNIFMVDYEAFGFEHQDATWYSYERYTDEYYANDLEELARLNEEFAQFNKDELSFAQQNTYQKIKEEIDSLNFLINNKDLLLMRQTYIDQFGGYASSIPSTFEAYAIRTKQDIEDIISYIDSVYDAFMTYVLYAQDRAEAGYGFTNFTITKMVEYLDGVSGRKLANDDPAKEKPYYLIPVLQNKIKNAQEPLGLTDDEVADYLERLDEAFVNFINGHIDLAIELESKCMNLADPDKTHYLGSYGEDGKKLYEYLLRSRLGIDMPMEEYIEFLDTVTPTYFSGYTSYSSTSKSEAIGNGEVPILDTTDPLEIIEYLKEFAKTIVPDLKSTPEIDVAVMDKTVTENTTTLAYYMKSPLDSYSNEYIHLNMDALGNNYLETIKTLAHEGYPGHLYAYVTTKENPNLSNLVRVMTNTGHGEGWAKYVEIALGSYIAEQKGSYDWTIAMEQSKYWDLFIYNIYTRIDVGIHYEGWDDSQVYQYLKNCNLAVDEKSAAEIARDFVEMPGQYAAYGYGQSFVYEIHEEAKRVLGEHYNEIEFNAMLLENGWVGLSQLEYYYNQYMSEKCFLLGIEWNN